jgi:porphobilinogen synthase
MSSGPFSGLFVNPLFGDLHLDDGSSQASQGRSHVTGRSHPSTLATSVSIVGDISSQLHSGYSHPLSRSWQAERQLTKVRPHG